jgi:hypothetical protein
VSPAPGEQAESVIERPVGAHSEKLDHRRRIAMSAPIIDCDAMLPVGHEQTASYSKKSSSKNRAYLCKQRYGGDPHTTKFSSEGNMVKSTSRINLTFAATLVAASVLLGSQAARADDYCQGFEEGYQAGYCYQKFGCIPPISPICPIARIGEDGYQAGYNRGFLAGLSGRQ